MGIVRQHKRKCPYPLPLLPFDDGDPVNSTRNQSTEANLICVSGDSLELLQNLQSMTARLKGNQSWAFAAFALLSVLLLVNFRLLIGSAAPRWDADDLFVPYFTLTGDHARAGEFVLWDPWTSGGTPVVAEPEFGTFSPVTVIVSILTGGSETGFRVYWLLIWFLGPLGLLALARHLRAP